MTCLPRPCSIEGCTDVVWGRGWCVMHYWRWKRLGSAELPALKHKPSSRRMRITSGSAKHE